MKRITSKQRVIDFLSKNPAYPTELNIRKEVTGSTRHDYGTNNSLLLRMIDKGILYRELGVSESGRVVYFYYLTEAQHQPTKKNPTTHNFPKNMRVITKEEVDKYQAIEIIKACVKMDIEVFEGTMLNPMDNAFPHYYFDGFVSQTKDNPYDYGGENVAFVSVPDFIEFIYGKGNPNKIKPPYRKEVKLNDKYAAVVKKDEVEVGCQKFSHEAIDELYQASRKARGL